MTVLQMRRILENYRDVDEETGEVYCDGLIVGEYLGDGIFRCQEKGKKYENIWEMPEMAVTKDGRVLPVPR